MTDQVPDNCTILSESYPIWDYSGSGFFSPEEWLDCGLESWSSACWRGYVAQYLVENDQLYLTGLGELKPTDELAFQRARSRLPFLSSSGPPESLRVSVRASGTITIGSFSSWLSIPANPDVIALEFREGILVTPLESILPTLGRWHDERKQQQLEAEAVRLQDLERQRQRDEDRAALARSLLLLSKPILALHPNAVEGSWLNGVCPYCNESGSLRVCKGALVLCRTCYFKRW